MELLDNSAEIEDEKDKVLTADQLRTLKEVDTFTVSRLGGLQDELECISSCLGLKANGDLDMAVIEMRMFMEDKAGHKESIYMRGLDKRASTKLKADNESTVMQGVAAISMPNQRRQVYRGSAYTQSPGVAPGAPRGQGKGNAGGKSNGRVKNFVLQFIDGAYFDPTLAGVQAPAPSAFPGFRPYVLDSPSGGIVHGQKSS